MHNGAYVPSPAAIGKTVNHGLGTPRARLAAAEYLKAFVNEMNASGFIARSIERHGVQGLSPIK